MKCPVVCPIIVFHVSGYMALNLSKVSIFLIMSQIFMIIIVIHLLPSYCIKAVGAKLICFQTLCIYFIVFPDRSFIQRDTWPFGTSRTCYRLQELFTYFSLIWFTWVSLSRDYNMCYKYHMTIAFLEKDQIHLYIIFLWIDDLHL